MSRSRPLLPLCFAGLALLAAGTAAAGPGKARKITPQQISADVVVVDGQAYVPLADLAEATGCRLTAVKESKAYEAWPCKPGGLFVLDLDALRSAQKTVATTTAPTAPGSEVAFNPQPDPPHELRFDDIVASRSVVMNAGAAHLPLSEIARLLGGKMHRKGKRAWISVPPGVDAPLELATPSPQKVQAPSVD